MLTTMALPHGSLKAVHFKIGKIQVLGPYSGFMEKVKYIFFVQRRYYG
jgi:hypothetical protein